VQQVQAVAVRTHRPEPPPHAARGHAAVPPLQRQQQQREGECRRLLARLGDGVVESRVGERRGVAQRVPEPREQAHYHESISHPPASRDRPVDTDARGEHEPPTVEERAREVESVPSRLHAGGHDRGDGQAAGEEPPPGQQQHDAGDGVELLLVAERPRRADLVAVGSGRVEERPPALGQRQVRQPLERRQRGRVRHRRDRPELGTDQPRRGDPLHDEREHGDQRHGREVRREDAAEPPREVAADAAAALDRGVGGGGDAVAADDEEQRHADDHPPARGDEPAPDALLGDVRVVTGEHGGVADHDHEAGQPAPGVEGAVAGGHGAPVGAGAEV